MDDETFVQIFGLGSTRPRAGKEMEAIRAANFLMNVDPSGGEWIRFNRPRRPRARDASAALAGVVAPEAQGMGTWFGMVSPKLMPTGCRREVNGFRDHRTVG
jgi:hypothetical protein